MFVVTYALHVYATAWMSFGYRLLKSEPALSFSLVWGRDRGGAIMSATLVSDMASASL